MKIDTNALNLTQSLQPAPPINPESLKGTGYQQQAADGDQVQISDLAAQLSAQASATDPSRLARLQAAFQAGSYNVPPDQIAAGIIRELSS
jgi:anti-sigma28 factor (negative regulator of flagellin synthesis)